MLNRAGGERAAETRLLGELARSERSRTGWVHSERYDLDSSSSRLGSFTTSITRRWHQFRFHVQWLLSRQALLYDVPALFLIGFMVGRRRVLQETARHRKGLTYAAVSGLTASIVPAVARAFRHFAPAGRIGLTNYLLQSITMTVLFSRYGFSLKQPSTALWLGIDFVFFFGLQVPFSRWWIQRFRFGPAEWVWRSLTYGYPQAMRLAAPGVTHVISHSPPAPASHGAD